MPYVTRTQRQSLPLYVVPSWQGLPILHGFGTREVTLAQYVGDASWWIPRTRQVHGDDVHVLDGTPRDSVYVGDAFVTDRPGVLCAVRTADCLPLLLIDPVRRVVGAVHAGWRGLVAEVIQRTIATMVHRYRVVPERLQAALGPAIGPADYEVDAPVVAALRAAHGAIDTALTPTRTGHWQLDIAAVAQQILMAQGLRAERITTAPLSTFARPGEFHSHRRRSGHQGRQYSFIGLMG